jgi:hypothetical protein
MEKIAEEEINQTLKINNNEEDNEYTYKDIEIINEKNTEFKLNEDKSESNLEENKKTYDYVRNFEWSEEMEENAKKIIQENTEVITDKFIDLQARNWDKFYKHNTTNFFKDRHYILSEFPELKDDIRVSTIK